MKDIVWGNIEYDYSWFKEMEIYFNGRKESIVLLIAGEDDGKFEKEQYEAYEQLINKWSEIEKDILVAVKDYYIELREELGYDEMEDENYPEIKTTEEILERIKLVGIKVPYGCIYGGKSIGLSFDCTWDEEDGLGIRLNDEKIIEVGYQDIAI